MATQPASGTAAVKNLRTHPVRPGKAARRLRRRGRRSLAHGKRFPVSTEWRVELTYRLVPEFYTLDRKVIFPAAATVGTVLIRGRS